MMKVKWFGEGENIIDGDENGKENGGSCYKQSVDDPFPAFRGILLTVCV